MAPDSPRPRLTRALVLMALPIASAIPARVPAGICSVPMTGNPIEARTARRAVVR